MTVPKISDHHHLLQAPANQLSVLPKKKVPKRHLAKEVALLSVL